MKRKHVRLAGIAVLILPLTVVRSVLAQAPTGGETGAPQAMSPEQMQRMMAQMMPSEGHKVFETMTGKFTTRMKVWQAPGTPPMESAHTGEGRLIYDGRFQITEYKGTLMGMPMERMIIMGYDSFNKFYTMTFISNLSTATESSTGTFDETGKVLTLRGEMNEPHGKTPVRHVIRMVNDDVHVFESYTTLPDGTEFQVIEETITRVK